MKQERGFVPKAFNPSGWDSVKTEMVKKESKLRQTSGAVYNTLLEQHGTTNNTPAGWAYFNKAGFVDANDAARIVKRNFPPRPHWYDKRPAGHDDVDAMNLVIKERCDESGRAGFLDRTDPEELQKLCGQKLLQGQSRGPVFHRAAVEGSKSITWINNEGSFNKELPSNQLSITINNYQERAALPRSHSYAGSGSATPVASRLATPIAEQQHRGPIVLSSKQAANISAGLSSTLVAHHSHSGMKQASPQKSHMARSQSLTDHGPKYIFGGQYFAPQEPSYSGSAPFRDGQGQRAFNKKYG